MNLNEYQELASRTAGNHFSHDMALCNWALGLCGEAGEYSELVKKQLFHGKNVPIEDKIKELGDVLYYLAMCARENNLSLEQVAQTNIDKLKKRYPNGFELGGGKDRI